MNWTALKIISPFLRTRVSKEGGSFEAHSSGSEGGYSGCGETLSLALQCLVTEGIHGEVEGQNLMILVNRDAALNTLEEQGPMEKMHGAAGWEISSLKYFKTSSRMSVCNAARYHVSVYISVYRQYVQSYI